METRFAYLAEDKLYLKDGQDPPRLVESQFAQNAIDRASRDNQRNAWKRSTLAEGFARQMVWNSRDADLGARIVQTTGLAVTGDELFYAMNVDSMGGLFTQGARDPSERRLLHRQNLHVRDLCRHADGTLLLSLQMNDGTANIATLDQGGRGVREVTEGDSVDRAPSWVPGREGQIIFQSAGVGRNAHGMIAGVGPFSIQQLDLRSGELTTLVEDDRSDLLMPKQTADGFLHYIRRPYKTGAVRLHPLKVLGDVVFFPYRLIRMFIAFGNWLSIAFAGKPLITAGAPTREPIDQQRHLMLFGKMIDAQKALKANKGEAAPLVPDSWELIRRSPQGQETALAKGVLAYDLYPDGSILFTNGSGIFHQQGNESAKRLHQGKLIEHVVAIAGAVGGQV